MFFSRPFKRNIENNKLSRATLYFPAQIYICFASMLIKWFQVTHLSHFCSRMEAQCLIKTGLGRFGTVTFRAKGTVWSLLMHPPLCSQSVCLLTGMCHIKELWTIHTHGNCREAYWEYVCLFKARLCDATEVSKDWMSIDLVKENNVECTTYWYHSYQLILDIIYFYCLSLNI